MTNEIKNKKDVLPSTENAVTQLIIFLAGDEEFGIPIAEVREIIKMEPITLIPNLPPFIKGIINVRGEIVTTIDIKSRFSLLTPNVNTPKHIIVTKQEEGLFGLIVDEVIEVLRIQGNEIKPAPTLVTKIHKKYISGVVTYSDRLIIILDLSKILTHNELIKAAQWEKKIRSSSTGSSTNTSGHQDRQKD